MRQQIISAMWNVIEILRALTEGMVTPVKQGRSNIASNAIGLHLPPHLKMGAATAAHQVEGGTTNNNWTRWERTVRPDGRSSIFGGDTCSLAADHWRRFDDDLERMKALGLKMYRFSVEWSRIEPSEGRFDDAAMQRYRGWCEKLRAADITPMVTLHHFTEPLWITDRGGFESAGVVRPFGRFVRYVARHLHDLVDLWITVNEPVVYALLGWGTGEFPPGKRDPRQMGRVLVHLLLAHAEAYHALHEFDGANACSAAPASNIVIFEPASGFNPIDAAISRLLDRAYNHAVLRALDTGHLRLYVPGIVDVDVRHEILAGTWDFAAVNHYFRLLTSLRFIRETGMPVGFDPACEKNDMGWDLTPHSLYDSLRLVGAYGKPIYVTENGTCDASIPDRRRTMFLTESLQALAHAVNDGVDVRAYLYWSLLDNFEWAHGFAPRFGLYRVDYETQERTLTQAGELYRRIATGQASDTRPGEKPTTR